MARQIGFMRAQVIGVLVTAATSLATASYRWRANDRELKRECDKPVKCAGHEISVRSVVHENVQAALAVGLGLAMTLQSKRLTVPTILVALGSLGWMLRLRKEFVDVDDQRQDESNDKADIIYLDKERKRRRVMYRRAA